MMSVYYKRNKAVFYDEIFYSFSICIPGKPNNEFLELDEMMGLK